MNKTTRQAFNDALEDDEAFLSFLTREAQSEEHRGLKGKVEAGTHPASDHLWHYVLGGLDDRAKGIVGDHVAFCGKCRDEVATLRLANAEPDRDMRRWARPLSWHERLSAAFDDWRATPWLRPLVASAACLIACLTLHQMTTPPTGALIAKSGQTDFLREGLQNEALTLPWEPSGRSFGLASGDRRSPGRRAFGAGIWSGRRGLSRSSRQDVAPMPAFLSPRWKEAPDINAGDWRDTPWRTYLHAGEWAFLLRAAALSDAAIPDKFWEDQRLILAQIQEGIAGRSENEAKVLVAAIRRISAMLEDTAPEKGQREQLASELDNLMTYLSPRF